MIIIGVLLNVVGFGVSCWALFALAIHALPFFVSMATAIYTYETGAGPLGAIIVAFVAGGFTLVLGQYAFSVARSPIVRLVIGLLFAVPAARAGYDVPLHTWVFPRNGGSSRSLRLAPWPSAAPPGRACRS